jgi:ribosomal protein L12E/L44/L45/RPP1/RPP2
MEKKTMSLNQTELHVVRLYQAVTGADPTQEQLDAAFDDYNSLIALAQALVADDTQSNADYVAMVYANMGIDADEAGVEYWTAMMSSTQSLEALSKGAMAMHFQNAAFVNGMTDTTAAEATLSSGDNAFAG